MTIAVGDSRMADVEVGPRPARPDNCQVSELGGPSGLSRSSARCMLGQEGRRGLPEAQPIVCLDGPAGQARQGRLGSLLVLVTMGHT